MNVFDLMAKIGLDTSEYESGLTRLGKGIGTAGKVIGAAVAAGTAAVTAFGKSAIDTGSEFDSAMSQIAATMGMTMDEIQNNVDGKGDIFEALREKAKQMGSETNFSASEAAEGLNILAMSGFDAEKSMSMVEDVLHLAAAGSMDMASAAAYVAGNLKGFNDESKTSAYYADLMAKGATLANTSVSQLGEAMSGGAASASAYGQTAESMTVALLRLAEQGEAGSAASTALAAAMKNIYTPTDQAKDALKELGVAAYDSKGNARDFNTVVNELSKALDGMSDSEANAYKDTIFGIQGLDAFNKMTVTSIEKQNEWAEALAGATGEASKQYDTMTDNLQGDIDIFNSALDGLKIAVSDTLMSSAREFVQFGSDALSQITKGFEEGGIDGAMDVIGKLIGDGLKMITAKLPAFLKAGTTLIKSLITGVAKALPDVIAAIMDSLPEIISAVIDVLPYLTSSLIGGIIQIGDAIVEMLPDMIPELLHFIVLIASRILGALPEFIRVGVEIFYGLMEGFVEAIPDLIEFIPTIIDDIVWGFLGNLPTMIQAGIKFFMALVEAMPEIINEIVNWIPYIIESIVDALLDNLPAIIDAGITLFVAMVEAMPEIIISVLEAEAKLFKSIFEYIVNSWPEIKEKGLELFKKLGEGIEKAKEAVGEAVDKILTAIAGWIGGMVDKAKTWGKDLIQNFIDGLMEKWDALKKKVSDIAGSIKDYLGFSEPKKGPLSNFHTYAPDMMDLFAKGIKDNEHVVTDQIAKSFDFGEVGTITARVNAGVTSTQGTAQDMAAAIREALEGYEIQWNDRNLGRLVQAYA